MLVCYFAKSKAGEVSFAPLKVARVDEEGILRLFWWKGNELMKHESVPVEMPNISDGAAAVFRRPFDTKRGVILEGRIQWPEVGTGPRPGVYFECADGSRSAVMLDRSGRAEFGRTDEGGSEFELECSVDREVNFGETAALRLLTKESLTELYLDDLLIGNFSLPADSTGRIGVMNTSLEALNPEAWVF